MTHINKELQKAQSKLSGVNEKNNVLNNMTKQSTMTIKEYEKALSELRAAVVSLSEENTLLRDFAYNVDPNARLVHAHMMTNQRLGTLPESEGTAMKARSLSVNSGRNS